MKAIMKPYLSCCFLILVLPGDTVSSPAAPEGPTYCSPVFMASDAVRSSKGGRNVYIADESGSRILHLYMDAEKREVRRAIALPARPTGLTLSPDGDRLYVTSQSPAGEVFVVETATGRIESVLRAGHTTMAPVLSLDASTLYVCNRFDHSLSVIDLKTKAEGKRLPLVREPVAAALTSDGSRLVVANHKTPDPSTASDVACSVSIVQTRSGEVTNVRLPNGSVALRGICTSPDGRHAFVTHILARNHVPATQLESGWLTTNAVSVIEIRSAELIATLFLDDPDRGAANPWGITTTPDGKTLCVALAGVHEITLIDLPGLLERIEGFREEPTGAAALSQAAYTNFAFLHGLKRRVSLRGKGPRHLAVVGGKLLAGMYFDGAVEILDLQDSTPTSALGASETIRSETIPLASEPPASTTRRGESLFHDASICFQGWQSCSSCHPDGRVDGLNWDLTNDGLGNSKNARSLLFAGNTPPNTMAGVFESLDVCVRVELKTILFTDVPDADAAAIVDYIQSLRPVQSPKLRDGNLSAAARRGEKAFAKAGCIKCHVGEYYTARETKNVGTFVIGDHRDSFDIPSLREAWRTAPYLHDGRAATIEEVITTFNESGRHGEAFKLTLQERDDLIEFVLSL